MAIINLAIPIFIHFIKFLCQMFDLFACSTSTFVSLYMPSAISMRGQTLFYAPPYPWHTVGIS